MRAVDLRPGAGRGNLSTVAGEGSCGHRDGSRAKAQFNLPRGVAVSTDGGTLYVADTANHRIRAVGLHAAHAPDHAANEVTTVAGSGAGGYKDGDALAARFFGPNHVAVSPDGKTVVVVDTANDRLRYVDLFPASTAPTDGGAHSLFTRLFARLKA